MSVDTFPPHPSAPRRPRLAARIVEAADGIALDRGGTRFHLEAGGVDAPALGRVLRLIDGGRDAEALEREAGGANMPRLIRDLAAFDLVDEAAPPAARSGRAALFAIEDRTNRLLFTRLYRNRFWRAMLDDPHAVPERVFHGMAIENYHFLFRESWFDSPVLAWTGSTPARVAMNRFYGEEVGHDELILKALEAVGLDREILARTVPLPETMALANALSHWARTDPILFFATLGVLEGRDIDVDSFVRAAERRGMDEAFIGPIRAHAGINMNGGHGLLTREIFDALDGIGEDELGRVIDGLDLFVELYDDFYGAILDHYAVPGDRVRRVEGFAPDTGLPAIAGNVTTDPSAPETAVPRRPKLRDGVGVAIEPASIRLDYGDQGCAIDILPEGLDEARRLMAALAAGAPRAQLAAVAPGFGAAGVGEILQALDGLGLLEDADPGIAHGVSGAQAMRELRRFVAAAEARICTGALGRAFAEGSATRAQLIGYAIEYHQVVRMGPRAVAPALGHAGSPARTRLLEGFLAEEVGHDRTLADALAAVGIDEDLLDRLVPLPETFALTSTLAVLAAQDPVSFEALLFLFERPAQRFHDLLVDRARALDMPEGFWSPLVWHAGLNDEGAHGDISSRLMGLRDFVGREQTLVTLKAAVTLLEAFDRLERRILSHYGQGADPIPTLRLPLSMTATRGEPAR
ncbi:iron-containing redox enzyme family protein [Tistrella mobilis]|uniref:iron-containing redox enzyme family protein n=1 Tax=Tistrella mobilis TaxID=171437 RepID=UPI0031F6A8C7